MAKVYEIVAVYDNMTEAFLQPTFVETLAEAQRLFEYQINNIGLWHENSSDFDLYSLGKYDATNGVVTSEVHKMIKGRSVWRESRKENKDDIRSASQTDKGSDTGRD